MSILMPLLAAVYSAIGVILNKIALSYQKVGHRQFLVFLFFSLFFLSAILYPFLGTIDPRAFTSDYLFLLFLIIIIASIYNILFYHALEKEKIIEWQLVIMLTPLSTIIIASIFLRAERNLGVFLAGIVASVALFASHLNRRHHLNFDVFQKGLLLYLILYPLEAVLVKELLFLYSPLALYMVRTLGVFIVLFIWYLFLAPYIKGEPKLTFSNWRAKNYKLCFVIALLAVLQMVFTYYGYKHFGVVFTTIVLTLGPILTYIADVIILKERLKKRIVLAAIVILACVAYANIALGR